MDSYIIEPLTNEWWWGIGSGIVFISSLILFFKNKKRFTQEIFMKVMSLIFLTSWVYALFYELYHDIWSIQESLPLHLCRVSFIICIFNFWRPKQWMFEWCLFLSLPSGLHAILTPELTMGKSNWILFYYYFSHSAILLVPLYLSIVMKRTPRKNAWIKSFWYLQILVAISFPLNFIIDSNYLYLKSPPSVNNPFLIGEWPWYIIVLELSVLLHVFILRIFFPSKKLGY